MVAWLTVPLMLAMIYEVIARYVFTAPTVWAYDMSRMLYGSMFVLGAAYALSKGVHIRSDFLYRTLVGARPRAASTPLLYMVFFFPTMLIFLWVCADWAWTSVSRGERGIDTAWTPLLGPAKSALPIGIALLIAAGHLRAAEERCMRRGKGSGRNEPRVIGIVMIGAMLVGIFIGFPISFTLLFLGLVFGYWGFGKLVFYLLTLQFNASMMEQTLAAVPLFVFMGIMMEQANLMERLFDACRSCSRD